MQVTFSVPRLSLESLGAILETLRVNREGVRYALVVHAGFKLRDAEVRGYLVIVLSVASLDRLLREVEEWEREQPVNEHRASIRRSAGHRLPRCGSRSWPIAVSSSPTMPWWSAPGIRGSVTYTGIAASDAVGAPLLEVCPAIAARGLDEHYRERARRRSARAVPPLPQVPDSRHSQRGRRAAARCRRRARIAPLTAGGRIIGTITIVEDVSERVVSERELRNQILVAERARAIAEDASKLKDEFLATLSHEIRTPLNAVLGWARILRTQPEVKSRDHALEVIERNAASQLGWWKICSTWRGSSAASCGSTSSPLTSSTWSRRPST